MLTKQSGFKIIVAAINSSKLCPDIKTMICKEIVDSRGLVLYISKFDFVRENTIVLFVKTRWSLYGLCNNEITRDQSICKEKANLPSSMRTVDRERCRTSDQGRHGTNLCCTLRSKYSVLSGDRITFPVLVEYNDFASSLMKNKRQLTKALCPFRVTKI